MSNKKRTTLRLILGDQLNYKHSWFRKPDDSIEYVMMEVRQETDYVKHHIQKVCSFFASMRTFADWLRAKGHSVRYLKLDDKNNRQDLEENLREVVRRDNVTRFEYQLPDEYRLDLQLRNISEKLGCETEAVDSEHFLARREEVGDFFGDRKQWRMENFYREMRRKHDVLIENGQPAGGQWNYDVENRNKYSGQVPLPEPKLFSNDVSDIARMLEQCGVETFGSVVPDRLIWPTDRKQSLALLKYFVDHLLQQFGTYQDAMTTDSWSLFHCRLSFALNTKMLHPRELLDRVTKSWQERPGEIGLPQVEGFIRQILGWREYMRGVYWHHMPQFGELNFFGHERDLPHYYWDGDTRMNCMAESIGQSLKYAYAHHIQRLMVTGNFALLAGVDPSQVDAWYLGVYIDALEWVEMPNTRGMSQFADGGITASKPYVSTANYIDKMSDYCGSCFYERKRKYGERACPFNSLHWEFYHRHRKKLEGNPRVVMMYRVWDKINTDEQKLILDQALRYKKELEKL